jgi:hypothetical protein
MPITNEQFADAIHYLTSTNALTGVGALFVDKHNQLVLDEGNFNTDITPDEAILTQALIDLAARQVDEQAQDAVRDGAKAQVEAIPNWASWTETEALTWHDTNITNALPVADLAEANVVLNKMAQELRALVQLGIASRNKQWPDLEGN